MTKYLKKYLLGFLLTFTCIGAVLFPVSVIFFLGFSFGTLGHSSVATENWFYAMVVSLSLFVTFGVFYYIVKAACLYIEKNEQPKK